MRFLSGFHFFIPHSEYRSYIFKEIHEVVFHGKGGYDWETVYNMPIWLRKYTFHEIKTYYDKEREEYEKASGKNTITADSRLDKFANNIKKQDTQKVNVPAFVSKVKSKPDTSKK